MIIAGDLLFAVVLVANALYTLYSGRILVTKKKSKSLVTHEDKFQEFHNSVDCNLFYACLFV